nr:PREDICTED: protein DOWNY MILDEW RESISTANCE 6-like isoform X1 [Musa acuminata subsp. malaccensis]
MVGYFVRPSSPYLSLSPTRSSCLSYALRRASSMADQLLSTVTHHGSLPETYVRPESQRPHLNEVLRDADVPTIDLGSTDLSQTVAQVADACSTYGFFQVVNHGVPIELMLKMMAVALEFFRLPSEEKAKLYSDDPAKKMRLSTSFNVRKEKFRNWRDYLRLHCYPLEEFVPGWPSNPSSFKYNMQKFQRLISTLLRRKRKENANNDQPDYMTSPEATQFILYCYVVREVVSSYCREVRQLGFRLLGLISIGLGLEEDYMATVLGEQEQHMAVNYYPKCPAPELTYGLQAHTDPNALTLLLQDPDVAGLQVRKDGKWIAVNPQPNAFVVNIGDQLQALSNGRYRSVWHRAVVNADKERISVASFLCPCNNAIISPPEKLVADGSPAMYRSYTYDEYYKKFWSRNLDDEHCLQLFRS